MLRNLWTQYEARQRIPDQGTPAMGMRGGGGLGGYCRPHDALDLRASPDHHVEVSWFWLSQWLGAASQHAHIALLRSMIRLIAENRIMRDQEQEVTQFPHGIALESEFT